MRIVLFDLGDTLVDKHDQLIEGAIEMLESVAKIRDSEGTQVELALVSDYLRASSPEQSIQLHQQYYDLLENVGLLPFFSPPSQRVTLSTETGVTKPDPAIFRTAIAKISAELDLHNAIFVTENAEHVHQARKLGMAAIHFKGPGQTTGDVASLPELVPLIKRFARFLPCCAKHQHAKATAPSVAVESSSVDPQVLSVVNKVSETMLAGTMSKLTAFPTRWSFVPSISKIPEWIKEQFEGIGYSDPNGPRFSPFTMTGSQLHQRNVLCGPASLNSGFVLVCAHYDSTSESPDTSAPGADDNASGIAVLLEVARLLKDEQLSRGVCFAAFGGEEQGLFGSQACAETAKVEDWEIDVVINLDMIAFQQPGREGRVVVEYDHGNKNPSNDAASKAFGLMMAQAAADYTSLIVEHGDIYQSDYMPFEALGYPCIGVYEGGDNPHYHKTTDTIDKIEINHLAEIAKMVVATVLQLNN